MMVRAFSSIANSTSSLTTRNTTTARESTRRSIELSRPAVDLLGTSARFSPNGPEVFHVECGTGSSPQPLTRRRPRTVEVETKGEVSLLRKSARLRPVTFEIVPTQSVPQKSGGHASRADDAAHGAHKDPTDTVRAQSGGLAYRATDVASRICLDGHTELLDSDHPILDETLSEDETMPKVYEIAGRGLEGAANLLLKLCQRNELEKHGKSNETKCQIETEIRRNMCQIEEDICRAWKGSPTPETVSTNVSGILGECYSFWDEEEEDGHPDHSYRGAGLVRDHSETAHNAFVFFITGAIGLFLCMAVRMGRGGRFEVWWAVGILCMVPTEMTSAFEGGDVWDDPFGLRMKRCRYLGGRYTINLKGNGRCEKWHIYLYGDKSMAVKCQGVEVLSHGVPPLGIGDVGFRFIA